MTETGNLLVVASCSRRGVDPETYDLLSFADRLRQLRPGRLKVMVIGEALTAAAEEIARRSGADVTLVETPGVSSYVSEVYCAILCDEIAATRPRWVCAAHTSRGWEWAPWVAARVGAGCISGVNGLGESAGDLYFEKDLYGGKVKGRYATRTDTTLITVQPGVFKFRANRPPAAGRVQRKVAAELAQRTRFLGTRAAVADTSSVSEAPIVVAVGNGIGDRENLQWVVRLAGILPRAAVAGSRILCDRGWLGYHQQVGVTGATVAPALYLALGISGAAQHVTGMRAAGFVIAVNTDPQAPIFHEADVGIVEDIMRFVPLVLDMYEESKTDD